MGNTPLPPFHCPPPSSKFQRQNATRYLAFGAFYDVALIHFREVVKVGRIIIVLRRSGFIMPADPLHEVQRPKAWLSIFYVFHFITRKPFGGENEFI
jgi:hypothetical protein